ncbi:hypothetical protein MCAP1_001790 [Malassezia caprae]|uniref:E3 SUMO-protein ligase pli1 n=1 Tax=Malassezia caprae TaxID=1381934 RepID=A0AAF0E766_9BASI|nr:hypothetical protein MCAP1_001790 [Malassezia caprae]
MELLSVPEICEYIGTLKVAELKEHIKAFNERLPFSSHIRLSGNKPELAQRLIEAVVAASTVPRHYNEMLVVMMPLGLSHWLGDVARMRQASQQYMHLYGHPPSHSPTGSSGTRNPGSVQSGMSGGAGYTPGTSRVPTGANVSAPASAKPTHTLSQGSLKQLHFWPSPFYEVKEFVSSIVQVPDTPPPSGRRQVGMSFTLSAKQVELLLHTPPTYQLRLFCTTFEHFMASVSPPKQAAPVEFPYTSEARINEHSLGVSLKGNKKHAGRVAPPNLNRLGHLHLQPHRLNRVELSYANAPMRYTMVVALCKVTSAEHLTEQLKLKQYRSKESVIEKMRQQAQDDDIVTGASTLKLTCPLTYVRLVTPCRANTCDHIQCFDALSFYSMNEQSPQWQCPVCSQSIKSEDLRLDGYVEDILRRVPADLDAVLVESDGTWHSADDQYHSGSPILQEPNSVQPDAQDLIDTPEGTPQPGDASSSLTPASHVMVPKTETATPPAVPSPAGRNMLPDSTTLYLSQLGVDVSAQLNCTPPPPADVIDLTLSSDDDT